MGIDSAPPRGVAWDAHAVLALLDVSAKVLLAVFVVQVAIDPAWGNLEGKAPGTRAVTYPMLALVLPLEHLWHRPTGPFPWGADLLLTAPAFSDLLGNRLLGWVGAVVAAVLRGLAAPRSARPAAPLVLQGRAGT